MLLADTNVVAYLLFDGPQGSSARALYTQDPEWHSEPLLFVELTNVLATGLRQKRLSPVQATSALAQAHAMLDGYLHPPTTGTCLPIAVRHGISGYDARFVCAALESGAPLVTEDVALRRKVPDATRSILEALAA